MRHLAAFALSALAISGCAARPEPGRFPLRDPLWTDGDEVSVHAPCHADEQAPSKRVCAPRPYKSSFAWDAADNLLFRPVARALAVRPEGDAVNVNAFDEVPDSSWFTNRIGRRPMTRAELARGPCDAPLDPSAPDGSWVIDQGKANGGNPGFRVRTPDGRRFMLKSDPENQPERATGATAIATHVYHAAGYWVPCDTVVYIRPSLLALTPGLEVTDNGGKSAPFDRAALDAVLAKASRRNGLVRLSASAWLAGEAIGPFRYEGVRPDDPNDVVPHEDRRDLRGARLLAAWLDHFDAREQNSMDTWLQERERDPRSPGHVRHYLIDLGDCFGSEWDWPKMSKRLGFAYYLDFRQVAEDLGTFGAVERPWDRAQRSGDGRIFGYFSARDFDAETWKPGYPNPAFLRMTERDGAWAARIIARFTPELVAAAVAIGDYTEPRVRVFLLETLLARQKAILDRYLTRVSPLADVGVEGDALCAIDLALLRGVAPASRFRYAARTSAAGAAPRVRALPGGRVCVDLAHAARDGGAADDDAGRYLVVDLTNGVAPGPLRAHLYDLGPRRGFRLVGIERPDLPHR